MSKLEELIAQLCPDGVKHIQLCEIAHYSKSRINTQEIDENTYIGVENLLQNKMGKTIASSVPSIGNVTSFEKGNILIGNIRPYLRKIWLADCNGGTNGDVLTIQIDDEKMITPEFLYYLLSSEHFFTYDTQNSKGTKMPRGDKNAVMKYVIPVPPLTVQSEIVRILDNFKELTAQLTAQLTAERTARKTQYEYYRDELFGKDYDEMLKRGLHNNVKVIALEELGKFTRGKRFVRDDIKEDGTPCIHYGDLYTYYGVSAERTKCFLDKELARKMRFAHKGNVVIVQAGENDMDIGVGVAWMGNEAVAVHDACYIFEHNINPKYISHYLRTNIYHLQIKKYVSTGKICSISSQGIGKALIPVPSMEEQQRIVSILDRYDALRSDISTRLSAEIDARKKQYEYYREKFLTFIELS